MSCTDLTSIKVADKDLAQTATLSSILYPVTWLIIIYTTEVGGELPLISLSGLLLIGLAIATRLVLGIGFDRIYERLSWRRWQQAYGATIILNAGTWGVLNAILIWYYFPTWPAYLVSFCTPGRPIWSRSVPPDLQLAVRSQYIRTCVCSGHLLCSCSCPAL
jgi:hypothetical protein